MAKHQRFQLAGPEPTGFGLGGRRLSPFLGRDLELRFLLERLDRSRDGLGQVVWITGEPGVGKSRLLFELRQRLDRLGVPCLEGRCTSHGANVAYYLLHDLLCSAWELPEDPAELLPAVRGRIAGVAPSDLEAGLVLGAWLGVDVERPAGWTPEVLRRRAFDMLREIILDTARPAGCALLLEDLHWVDEASEAFLTELLHHLPTSRVLLVLSARPGHGMRPVDRSFVSRLALPALTRADSATLVRAVLPAAASSERLLSHIVERAEGNPFFLEELIWAVGEGETQSVPETVTAALMARMDRLDVAQRGVLEAAAVLGREIALPILTAMLADQAGLSRILKELVWLEFLQLKPGSTYVFKHALTQDVAYGRLTPEQQRALHAAAGKAFETLAPHRLEDLAHHWGRTEDWERAATYLRRAGSRALRNGAYRDAAQHFERVLTALDRAPASLDILRTRADVRFGLHDALLPLAEYARLRNVLQEIEVLAQSLGDHQRIGRAYAYMSHNAWIDLADNERAADYAARALRIAEAEGNRPLEMAVSFYWGQIHLSRGDLRASVTAFARCIACATVPSPRPLEVFFGVQARTWAVYAHADLGLFDEGLTIAEESLRIAEKAANHVLVIRGCTGLGHMHMSRGAIGTAIGYLQRGLSIPGARDVPQAFWALGLCTASALSLVSKRGDEAVRSAEEVLNVSGRIAGCRPWSLRILADAYLASGRHADALDTARKAVEMARIRHERGFEAHALRTLGLVCATGTRDVRREAEGHLFAALEQSRSLGMRPLAAHCQKALGDVYQAEGRVKAAREVYDSAAEMYRELGMQSWLEAITAAPSLRR